MYGNATRKCCRIARAVNGRYAILAKKKADDPHWTQIESILTDRDARSYADEIEYDDEARAEAVSSNEEGTVWSDSDDRPAEMDAYP